MNPEELREVFRRAVWLRSPVDSPTGGAGYTPEQVTAYITDKTDGKVTDMMTLAGMVGDASMAVTPEEEPKGGIPLPDVSIPAPLPGGSFNPRRAVSGTLRGVDALLGGGLGEAAGLGNALLSGASPVLPSAGAGAFERGRAPVEDILNKFEETNPKTAMGIDVAGGLTSAVAAPAALGVRAASTIPRLMAQGAGIGGAEAATIAALNAETGERGQAAAEALPFGALLGGALPGAPAIINRVRKGAPTRAVKDGVGFVRNWLREKAGSVNTALDDLQQALPGNRKMKRADPFRLSNRHELEEIPDQLEKAASLDADEMMRQVIDQRSLTGRLLRSLPQFALRFKLGVARFIGSGEQIKLTERQRKELREAAQWVRSMLDDPNPQVQDDFLELIRVPEAAPISPLVGAGSVGGQPAINPLLER